jgi:hypothetical protein
MYMHIAHGICTWTCTCMYDVQMYVCLHCRRWYYPWVLSRDERRREAMKRQYRCKDAWAYRWMIQNQFEHCSWCLWFGFLCVSVSVSVSVWAWVCEYVCVCVSVWVCQYDVWVCECVCVCVCVCVCERECVRVCVCVWVSTWVCVSPAEDGQKVKAVWQSISALLYPWSTDPSHIKGLSTPKVVIYMYMRVQA